ICRTEWMLRRVPLLLPKSPCIPRPLLKERQNAPRLRPRRVTPLPSHLLPGQLPDPPSARSVGSRSLRRRVRRGVMIGVRIVVTRVKSGGPPVTKAFARVSVLTGVTHATIVARAPASDLIAPRVMTNAGMTGARPPGSSRRALSVRFVW
ncbi:MAG TPA: hypothetical protein VLD18_04995, partial [Verrucomicrobiae bacterium]|nr:hypothetical protein [Verrucomicrobiae bacterium]